MTRPNYAFQPGETGTLVEIYLPAKYHHVLLDILELALEFDHVNQSLPESLEGGDDDAAKLRRLLPESIQARYGQLRRQLHEFADVYVGFSVFNVDGAFAESTGNSAAGSRKAKFVRELTTVARILLRPDYGRLYDNWGGDREEARKLAKSFFASGVQPEDFIAKRRLAIGWRPGCEEELLISQLGKWQDLGALFIYGYIVRQITEIPQIQEKEIWVTSYHNPVVNVIRDER